MKKKILISLGIVYIVFALILGIAISGNNDKKENKTNNESPKWMLAEHEYGDKYPYTEYYLELYCYKDSVWLENAEGDIYPLNGIAKSSYLKNNPKFKNSTKPILKKGMQDLFTPSEALNICFRLDDAQFESRIKRK